MTGDALPHKRSISGLHGVTVVLPSRHTVHEMTVYIRRRTRRTDIMGVEQAHPTIDKRNDRKQLSQELPHHGDLNQRLGDLLRSRQGVRFHNDR